MKKITLMCAFILAATSFMMAGNKFSIKQITDGEFAQETMLWVDPQSDGESYLQISADKKRIVKSAFKNGKQLDVLFDVDKVKSAIKRIDGYVISPDGRRILIETNRKAIYRRSFTADYYLYTVGNSRVEKLSEGGAQQTPIFSPDGNMVAFVRDNNIFLVKLLYDNSESQVTTDGKFNEIINGIPDWVNEEEFSFNNSMVFTADSRQLVWVRYDESKVKQYCMQLFKGLNPERKEFAAYPGAYSYKYPVAGEDNSSVKLMSFDIKSRQTRTMQLPLDADGYISRICMTGDPSRIAVFTLNRHQDDLKVYMANPLSTVCKLVIEDKVDKYINENVFAQMKITDKYIILPSERDGYNHIYIYNLNGQLVRKATNGKYVVNDVYGYNEQTGDLYYAANPKGATDQQVMVSHQNGKEEILTTESGWNTAVFSANFNYFINVWNDMNTPWKYTIRNNKGKVLLTTIDNAKLKSKLAEYEQAKKELFSFTTSEGITLNGWMIKPANFDPNKKYPVVMYQYGGPGNQQVKNSWDIGMSGAGGILEQYFAQEGFITVCVDNRGTGGRGAEFEKCTYLRLGELEARDQVEAAIWLGKQSYVDKERIGIWGWSYGGWNTLMSMSEGRPVFRAGVAIAPPTCWRFYDTIYTERFMRTPKENPSGYDEVNPIARVGKLHGALLLCHGFADDNVHFQNMAEYTEALVQADKDFKENFYVNRNHNISGGNTRNHLFRQAFRFFVNELMK